MKKKFILAATAVIAGTMIVGCGSSKKVAQEVAAEIGSTEVVIPLSEKEYQTDKDFFRATQLAKSPNLAMAKKMALANAKTLLAENIQSTIKAVTENYVNQRTVGDKDEYEGKAEELSRNVVNQTLTDIKIIGEKVFKENDGKYTYHIAVEMSKTPVANRVADQISKDAKLQLDFDKHQFLKTFDDEMDKFENK
ncbi:hypothetical protein AGMMS49965_00020 [Bacteroidia bacterium]|nr:hypothetical protein AGMMS49965_00020 [Bacteroidia bacterium]